MNILNTVVNGAASAFGREFGRAGANAILRGANSYTVNGVYSGRIKPSDSLYVRTIKELNKASFRTTNKGNISILISLTDLVLPNLEFRGRATLDDLQAITDMIDLYVDKFNHGSALVADDYEDKSVDYLQSRRQELVDSIDSLNEKIKSFVSRNLAHAESKMVTKKKQVVKFTIIAVLLCWTIIVPLVSIYNILRTLMISTNQFNAEKNKEFVYFKRFSNPNLSIQYA
jgi:hypothetical protein